MVHEKKNVTLQKKLKPTGKEIEKGL